MSVGELMTWLARPLADDGFDLTEGNVVVRALVRHVCGLTREQLWTERGAPVAAHEVVLLFESMARYRNHEPLPYILGTREFYKLDFDVTPAVLIPRPETELLVELALAHIANNKVSAALRIADIGTGNGCIAISIAANCPNAHIFATDISPDALAVAHRNAAHHNAAMRVTFLHGDLCDPLRPHAPFDIIVSNPPYIASSVIETLQHSVRDHEPRVALDGGDEGLDFYRRLAHDVPPFLAPNGLLAVEVGQGQADNVAELWHRAGLANITIHNDFAGIGRVVCGTCRKK